jgi:hypothetical protein
VMPSTSSANAIASNPRVDSGVSGPRGGGVQSRRRRPDPASPCHGPHAARRGVPSARRRR